MPIADCGFPPVSVVPGTMPPQISLGPHLLTAKGPTTHVEIGFDPGLFHADPQQVQAAVAALTSSAKPAATLVEALIDTGACESCIDDELAKQLQLPLIDHIDGSGIGGQEKFDVYLGYIRIAALDIFNTGDSWGSD
jgi:hypothetical protein